MPRRSTSLRVGARETALAAAKISQFQALDRRIRPAIKTALRLYGKEGGQVCVLAQVFGRDLALGQQVAIVLMSVLAGVGTAGVPGGSPRMVSSVLVKAPGVPGEGIGIILGVDRLLDMSRTVLNVVGDLTIATCVARGEPEAPEPG